jgi:hypothetical protein
MIGTGITIAHLIPNLPACKIRNTPRRRGAHETGEDSVRRSPRGTATPAATERWNLQLWFILPV